MKSRHKPMRLNSWKTLHPTLVLWQKNQRFCINVVFFLPWICCKPRACNDPAKHWILFFYDFPIVIPNMSCLRCDATRASCTGCHGNDDWFAHQSWCKHWSWVPLFEKQCSDLFSHVVVMSLGACSCVLRFRMQRQVFNSLLPRLGLYITFFMTKQHTLNINILQGIGFHSCGLVSDRVENFDLW